MRSDLPEDFRIETVLQTIDFNPAKNIRDLARAVNLSSSRLSHLFKAKTGFPLAIFLADRRMEKAADLLRTTDMRVKEITYSVGYQQQPSFIRAFRKRYECSPTTYRNRQRLLCIPQAALTDIGTDSKAS